LPPRFKIFNSRFSEPPYFAQAELPLSVFCPGGCTGLLYCRCLCNPPLVPWVHSTAVPYPGKILVLRNPICPSSRTFRASSFLMSPFFFFCFSGRPFSILNPRLAVLQALLPSCFPLLRPDFRSLHFLAPVFHWRGMQGGTSFF